MPVDTVEQKATRSAATFERALIGALLVAPAQLAVVQPLVSPDDFLGKKTRAVFESLVRIQGLDNGLKDGTSINVLKDLQMRGLEPLAPAGFLSDCMDETPHIGQAESYAKKVRRLAKMRRLDEVAISVHDHLRLAEDMDDDEIAELHAKVTRSVMDSVQLDRVRSIRESMGTLRLEAPSRFTAPGYPTSGLRIMDQESDIFEPHALTVIAARPGIGKSSFLRHLIRENSPSNDCLFFTLEEPAEMARDKLVCREARIEYDRYVRREITDDEKTRFIMAMGVVAECKIDLYDVVASANEIAMTVRRMIALGKQPRIIFVDHLQCMKDDRSRGEGDEQAIKRQVQTLTELAKSTGSSVILASQLNREVDKRECHRPILSDLRGSGSIEMFAYNVVFLWCDDLDAEREKQARGDLQTRFVCVAKQRNGTPFEFRVRFVGGTGEFMND